VRYQAALRPDNGEANASIVAESLRITHAGAAVSRVRGKAQRQKGRTASLGGIICFLEKAKFSVPFSERHFARQYISEAVQFRVLLRKRNRPASQPAFFSGITSANPGNFRTCMPTATGRIASFPFRDVDLAVPNPENGMKATILLGMRQPARD
jgi:hypothetical protein